MPNRFFEPRWTLNRDAALPGGSSCREHASSGGGGTFTHHHASQPRALNTPFTNYGGRGQAVGGGLPGKLPPPLSNAPIRNSAPPLPHVHAPAVPVNPQRYADFGFTGLDGVGFGMGVGVGEGCFGGGFANGFAGGAGNGAGGSDGHNTKRRRLQRRYSWGEEDLEFLRSLAEADSTADYNNGIHHNGNNARQNHQQQQDLMLPAPSLPPPPPATFTSLLAAPGDATINKFNSRHPPVVGGSKAPVTTSGGSCSAEEAGIIHGNTELTEVTAEEKLRAADDVAALLWRAGDRLRDRLLARVNDTWAKAEAELEAARNAAARGVGAGVGVGGSVARGSGAAGAVSLPHASKPFCEVLMERLEATRMVIEAELKAADEAAAATGSSSVLCNGPKWAGSRVLRGDVLDKLKDFQQCERNRQRANITAAAAAAVKAEETTRRQDLMDHLERNRQRLYLQAIENGIEPMQNDNTLTDIDDLTKGLLGQIEANHKAVRDKLNPVCHSGSELRESLHARLNATRAAAQEELTAADSAAAVTKVTAAQTAAAVEPRMPIIPEAGAGYARGAGSDGGDFTSDGFKFQPSVADTREQQNSATSGLGESRTTNGSNTGAGKKRKRSPGGGRRCKHEGW